MYIFGICLKINYCFLFCVTAMAIILHLSLHRKYWWWRKSRTDWDNGPKGEPWEKWEVGLSGPHGDNESSASVYTHWGQKSCDGSATAIYQSLYQACHIYAITTIYSWTYPSNQTPRRSGSLANSILVNNTMEHDRIKLFHTKKTPYNVKASI